MKVYTIGYGGRSPQEFLNLLTQKGVRSIVDVRLRPDKAAMGSYIKAKTPDRGIENLLSGAGIAYISLLELGNVFIDYDDWQTRYEQLFLKAGELLTERLGQVKTPFCLLCAEKRASECHRQYIATYLAQKWGDVEHIE
jgi:uncharacterized protein (DUF488 family)